MGNDQSEHIRTKASISTTHTVLATAPTSNPIQNQNITPSAANLLLPANAISDTEEDNISSHSSDGTTVITPAVIPQSVLASLFSVHGEKGNDNGLPQDMETPSNVNNTLASEQPTTPPPLSNHETIDTSPPVTEKEDESENIDDADKKIETSPPLSGKIEPTLGKVFLRTDRGNS